MHSLQKKKRERERELGTRRCHSTVALGRAVSFSTTELSAECCRRQTAVAGGVCPMKRLQNETKGQGGRIRQSHSK